MTLANYACDPEQSHGRLWAESGATERDCFQRDRDRILHAGAFRKLAYKTQVFVYHEGDYFRNRLTHSLEVAQIARSIARSLGLNEDLTEALALAHDLGHTPFGHAGERALNTAMADLGGFDHNEQTLRILTSLEKVYPDFDGLNLTWETIEGVVKHNGPLVGADGDRGHVRPFTDGIDQAWSLGLDSFASGEAQVAAIADDIAYNNHDIDDALRAGLLRLDDLREVELVGDALAEIERELPNLDESRQIRELVRRLIGRMVTDLLSETRHRLQHGGITSVAAIRAADQPVVAFSTAMQAKNMALKGFLFSRVYRHYKVNRMTRKAVRVVRDLFETFRDQPDCLPARWQAAEPTTDITRARLVADYIAGMTDRYALIEHRRLFDLNVKS
jgi:dGTPase